MYIYIIENLVNGKLYVGQTTGKDPKVRWRMHLYAARKSIKYGVLVDKAIKKYGENNFLFIPIEFYSTQEELDQAEIYWIKYLRDTIGRVKIYNIKDGGVSTPCPEETKLKISNSNKGRLSTFLGRKHSDESKKLMSARMLDRLSKNPHPKLGKPVPASIIEKIALAQRVLSPETEKEIIHLYNTGLSQRHLEKRFNVCKSTIGNILRRNGISKERKKWTDEEINYLKNKFDKLSLYDISIKLKKTKRAIYTKARRLKLI